MEINIEIVKVLITIIGSSLTTFFITRYTMKRNVPLEKMEIAYNRIYYPIFVLLKTEAKKEDVIKDLAIRIKKYNKYCKLTTIRLYTEFKETMNDNKSTKLVYQKLENDILDTSYYLRGKLGYLNPGFFESFMSFSLDKKLYLLSLLDLLAIYLLCLFSFIPIKGLINITATLIIVLLVFLVFISGWWLFLFVWEKVCCFRHNAKKQ